MCEKTNSTCKKGGSTFFQDGLETLFILNLGWFGNCDISLLSLLPFYFYNFSLPIFFYINIAIYFGKI